jgi:hypothetical protein
MQNWQANWEVERCRIGRRIGRCNDAILSGELRCAIGKRIGRFNNAELGGARIQSVEANWEVRG